MKKTNLKKLLAQMTLEEKVDQLLQLASMFYTKNKTEITGPINHFGLDDESLTRVGSLLGTMHASDVIAIQKKHLEEDRNKIPMLFMRDVIHGFRTIYPVPLGLSCSFDPDLAAECSRMAAKEASAGGIHLTFTPMVDYARDARWGRVMEGCGEDPLLASRMGAAQVKAFQGDDLSNHDNIAACVKHFAAYGGAEAGRDYNTVEISERVLRQYYLPAYKACIDAGVTMLMPSFNDINGVPSTANKWLMNKVLRREWGYKGLVISDYNAVGELVVHGVAKDMREAAKLAFECGVDIEMMSPAYHKHLASLIKDGELDEKQLDRSVMKVLRLKRNLGLFEDPYHGASQEKEDAICLSSVHREIARRAAEESAVLLKNDGTLPLSLETKKIALIGPFADNNAIKGSWACSGKDEETCTVREGIAELLTDAEITVARGCGDTWDDNDRSGFDEAVAAAKAADAVVLCLGEPQDYSGEGNCRTDIGLPSLQVELARAVIAANANTVVVLFNGRPLTLTRLDEIAPAILEMWYPGTEAGRAVADLIFGKANPCGKLAMSFPKSVGQCPIYYNYYRTGRPKQRADGVRERFISNYIDCGNQPLYFFGQGLSYTEFAYDEIVLDKSEMCADETLKVSVKITNTGKLAGKETVQFYLCDLVSSAVRPVQELIGFEKIYLEPGEIKIVTLDITEPMLRFWNAENKHVSEAGEFTVSVGYADHMKSTKKFTLK